MGKTVFPYRFTKPMKKSCHPERGEADAALRMTVLLLVCDVNRL
jgi:hypothetical protein